MAEAAPIQDIFAEDITIWYFNSHIPVPKLSLKFNFVQVPKASTLAMEHANVTFPDFHHTSRDNDNTQSLSAFEDRWHMP